MDLPTAGVDYMRHTLLFSPQQVHLQLTQHSSTTCPQSSPSEQPSGAMGHQLPPARWGLEPGLQRDCFGSGATAAAVNDAVTTLHRGGQASLLFCRAWLLGASRFGHLIQEIPWGELSCNLLFHTNDSVICLWYISAQYIGCPTALTVCYALKI